MRWHLRNNHRCYCSEFGSASDWLKQTSLTAVTNQTHYSDHGSNTSSLRNFSSRSSQTEGCPILTTNRTIGINGPSVWRIVSVCVYWTCVFGKDFRCEKSSFEFEDVYVMSGLRLVPGRMSASLLWIRLKLCPCSRSSISKEVALESSMELPRIRKSSV